MSYVISIFILGLMVTLLVGKGMLMANAYSMSEPKSLDTPVQTDKGDGDTNSTV